MKHECPSSRSVWELTGCTERDPMGEFTGCIKRVDPIDMDPICTRCNHHFITMLIVLGQMNFLRTGRVACQTAPRTGRIGKARKRYDSRELHSQKAQACNCTILTSSTLRQSPTPRMTASAFPGTLRWRL